MAVDLLLPNAKIPEILVRRPAERRWDGNGNTGIDHLAEQFVAFHRVQYFDPVTDLLNSPELRRFPILSGIQEHGHDHSGTKVHHR